MDSPSYFGKVMICQNTNADPISTFTANQSEVAVGHNSGNIKLFGIDASFKAMISYNQSKVIALKFNNAGTKLLCAFETLEYAIFDLIENDTEPFTGAIPHSLLALYYNEVDNTQLILASTIDSNIYYIQQTWANTKTELFAHATSPATVLWYFNVKGVLKNILIYGNEHEINICMHSTQIIATIEAPAEQTNPPIIGNHESHLFIGWNRVLNIYV